jgi:hypothetical protein
MTIDLSGKWLSGLRTSVALFYAVGRYRDQSEALTRVLAERVSEILPEGEYRVGVDGLALKVQRTSMYGAGMTCTPAVGFIAPGSDETKLQQACELAAEALRDFAAAGGKPHVSITADTIMIWWEAAKGREEDVRLAPIERAEIGM